MTTRRPALRLALSLLLGAVGACGSGQGPGPGSSTGRSGSTGTSPSGPSLSAAQVAYLRQARRTSRSIEVGDGGRDATLIAIGKDWCRWRRSPGFGDVSVRQFFDEIDVTPHDGAILRRAAEAVLCPR